MQLYKYDTSRDGTHKQAEGRSVDATLLVEELVEIYNTPPKGWREAEKVIVLIDWFLDDTILEASSSRVLLSKFWCKHLGWPA